jgi:hypothetical protein
MLGSVPDVVVNATHLCCATVHTSVIEQARAQGRVDTDRTVAIAEPFLILLNLFTLYSMVCPNLFENLWLVGK